MSYRIDIFDLVTAYIIFAMGATALVAVPWMPAENVALKGHDSFGAYLLGNSGNSTFFLTRNRTAVIRIATQDITSMQTCKPADYESQQETVNQIIHIFPAADRIYSYPACLPGYFGHSKASPASINKARPKSVGM